MEIYVQEMLLIIKELFGLGSLVHLLMLGLKFIQKIKEGARRFLLSFEAHLGDAGIGSISEVFDAIEPFTPRGCIAQAWSVAEVLRCWVKTAP